MAIGMLIILLQPFKSTIINSQYVSHIITIYHVNCLLYGYNTIIIVKAENNARWMIKKVVPLVGIFYVSPSCTGCNIYFMPHINSAEDVVKLDVC